MRDGDSRVATVAMPESVGADVSQRYTADHGLVAEHGVRQKGAIPFKER
ncbi:MAG: hypothetical protein IIC70_13530 [Acidobacteria bacterium]|nr:hypothetical protein [Acidobacteriota bacterium]